MSDGQAERVLRAPARPPRPWPAPRGIVSQGADGGGAGRRTSPGLDQEPGLAVHHLVRDPARARGHHRQAVRHRLQRDQARPFVARGVHEAGRRARRARGAAPSSTRPAKCTCGATRGREAAAAGAPSRAAAHDRPGPAGGSALASCSAASARQHVVESLVALEAAHGKQQRVRAAQRRAAPPPPRAAGPAGVSARDLVGIDAVGQHDHAVGGRRPSSAAPRRAWPRRWPPPGRPAAPPRARGARRRVRARRLRPRALCSSMPCGFMTSGARRLAVAPPQPAVAERGQPLRVDDVDRRPRGPGRADRLADPGREGGVVDGPRSSTRPWRAGRSQP